MPIVCEVCGRGPAPEYGGVGVHRQNPKGEIGIWRCDAHNEKPVDPHVRKIVDIIENDKQ